MPPLAAWPSSDPSMVTGVLVTPGEKKVKKIDDVALLYRFSLRDFLEKP